jgi:hypothetical protein
LPRSKGAQTEAVLVPLPYGRTELCPVRALSRWLQVAAITEGPMFRRIWLSPQVNPETPLPCLRLGVKRSPLGRSAASFSPAPRQLGLWRATSAATASSPAR